MICKPHKKTHDSRLRLQVQLRFPPAERLAEDPGPLELGFCGRDEWRISILTLRLDF